MMNDLMLIKMKCMANECSHCGICNECDHMFGGKVPKEWADGDIGAILLEASAKISFNDVRKMVEGLREQSEREGKLKRSKNESGAFFDGEENAYAKILNILKECRDD